MPVRIRGRNKEIAAVHRRAVRGKHPAANIIQAVVVGLPRHREAAIRQGRDLRGRLELHIGRRDREVAGVDRIAGGVEHTAMNVALPAIGVRIPDNGETATRKRRDARIDLGAVIRSRNEEVVG